MWRPSPRNPDTAERARSGSVPRVLGPAPRPQSAGAVMRSFPRIPAGAAAAGGRPWNGTAGLGRRALESQRLATVPPAEWSIRDVVNWVESTGYPQHKHRFLHNCIDGRLLLRLTNEQLKVRKSPLPPFPPLGPSPPAAAQQLR